MHVLNVRRRYAAGVLMLLLAVACSPQKQPAQRLIGEIDLTLAGASAEAAKFVPEQLAAARSSLAALKRSFDAGDYAAVLANAPEVLASAQSLAAAAATKKDEMLRVQNDAWTELATSVPAQMDAIESRLQQPPKKNSKSSTPAADLQTGRAAAAEAASLWSKSQAAFAAGNLAEAVDTAKQAKAELDSAAVALNPGPAG